MDWSRYAYLLGALVMAAAVLALSVRSMPGLTTPSRKKTRSELVLLGLVVALGLLVVYGRFYAGDLLFSYTDVGSDTSEQYVPYYLSLLRSIREGTLGTWSFDYGLGSSFMSYQSWTLDPFNLVLVPLCLVLGDSFLGIALVIVQSLKVVSCAYLFDHLLTSYCEQPLSRVLGASLFSFCGFLMLWGQHYWLGTVLVMTVTLLVALEALMARWSVPRFLAVMVMTALCVLMSTYSGFMIMLFAAVYALLRVIATAPEPGAGSVALRYLGLAAPVVCGLLVSMITVVPYASLLLGESSRVGGEGSSTFSSAAGYLTSFVPLRWVPAILSRLLGSGLICTVSDIPAELVPPTEDFAYVNVYEFIQLGFSVGAIILLGQFAHWVATEARVRIKIVATVAAALCLLYCFNFFLPALSNVFVDPKYRSSFTIAIPVCLAMSVGWEKRVACGRIAKAPLAACSAITLAVLAWSLVGTVDGRAECLVFLAAAVVLTGALLVPTGDDRVRAALLALACACLVGTSVVDAFFVTNRRSASTSETFPGASAQSADGDTLEALAWLEEQDPTLWRVEKLYTDWTRLNDALVQGYAGVSSYNSTLDSDVIDFYRALWPNMLVGDTAYQEYLNDPDHVSLLRILGVKYLLAHDVLPFVWATQIAQFGDVYVYQVQGAQSILSVRTGAISEGSVSDMDPQRKESLLSASAIVPDDVAAAPSEAPASDGDYTYDGNTVPGPDGQIVYEPFADVTLSGSSSITGTFSAVADSSVLCLAVPNTAGWKVYVDGAEVETFRVNYGFLGCVVSAGTHTIEARFEPVNLGHGVALAATGALLAATFCVIGCRRDNR